MSKFSEVAGLMQDNAITAAFAFLGNPAKKINNFITRTGSQIIPINTPCVKRLIAQSPYLERTVIRHGVYPGVPSGGIETVGTTAALVATNRVPSSVAALVAYAAFHSIDEFAANHPVFRGISFTSMRKKGVAPHHAGVKTLIDGGVVPKLESMPPYSPKGLAVAVNEQLVRLLNLLSSLQLVEGDANSEHMWEMARGQLDISRQLVILECFGEEMCNEFSGDFLKILTSKTTNISEIKAKVKLYMQALVSKAQIRDQIEKSDLQRNRIALLVAFGLLSLILLILIFAVAQRRGMMINQLRQANKSEKEANARERAHKKELVMLNQTQLVRNLLLTLMQRIHPQPLNALLSEVLPILLQSPECPAKEGCIFIYDPKAKKIQMVDHVGMSMDCVSKCSKINLGDCLCGSAAANQVEQFSEGNTHVALCSNNGKQKSISIPFFGNRKLLGVVRLPLKKGLSQQDTESLSKTVAVTLTGVLEKRNAEDEVMQLARFDVLTGLPNRASFKIGLESMKAQAKRDDTYVIVLFIDVDHFKQINDTYGHAAGDLFLIEIARRLTSCIREGDLLARLSGDEFAAAIRAKKLHELGKVLQRLREVFDNPIIVEEHAVNASLSIGNTVYPTDGEEHDVLVSCADVAMYRAKNGQKTPPVTHQPFSKSMKEEQKNRERMVKILEQALLAKPSWFEMYYQVLVDCRDGSIYGSEALIRLNHPDGYTIPPDLWIYIAEQERFMVQIGRWLILAIFMQIQALKKLKLAIGITSINISGSQLTHDKDLIKWIIEEMARHGLGYNDAQFEFTENFKPTDEMVVQLALLSKHARIVLDDYGTKGAVLSDLVDLIKARALKALKVDKQFVFLLPGEAVFVQTIFRLAKSLNLGVTAEGVENQDLADFLYKQPDVDALQGFFYSRPLPASEFEKLVRAHMEWVKNGKDAKLFWVEKHRKEQEEKKKNQTQLVQKKD